MKIPIFNLDRSCNKNKADTTTTSLLLSFQKIIRVSHTDFEQQVLCLYAYCLCVELHLRPAIHYLFVYIYLLKWQCPIMATFSFSYKMAGSLKNKKCKTYCYDRINGLLTIPCIEPHHTFVLLRSWKFISKFPKTNVWFIKLFFIPEMFRKLIRAYNFSYPCL